MADLVIPDCFLEDQAATVRAMLLPDEKCVNAPQMLLDVIGWACKLTGGEGKAIVCKCPADAVGCDWLGLQVDGW